MKKKGLILNEWKWGTRRWQLASVDQEGVWEGGRGLGGGCKFQLESPASPFSYIFISDPKTWEVSIIIKIFVTTNRHSCIVNSEVLLAWTNKTLLIRTTRTFVRNEEGLAGNWKHGCSVKQIFLSLCKRWMSQLNSRNKMVYHIYKVDRSQDYAWLIKSIDFFVHSR